MSYNINMHLKNDYSFLFSGMSTSSGGSLGNLNFLSDYQSIKNGSYGKLLKAYYKKVGNENTSTSSTEKEDNSSKLSTSLSKDSAKTLSEINKAAGKVKESADALTSTGKESVFNGKEVTTENEDGTTTTSTQYDMDAIYNAVSGFVKDYNSLVDSVNKSDSANVLKAGQNMTNITSLYSKTFEKVGITIGEDNKLSIDEDKFKSADVSRIKSLFNDSPSFAKSIASQASFVDYAANRESLKANTYNKTGAYSNNYSMGDIFNSMF